MEHSVELSEKSWKEAKHHAAVSSRSMPEQVEYWMRIGKIAEDNPDLPYSFIKSILLSEQEIADGDVFGYQFD